MKKTHSSKRSRRAPKAILRLPDLDHAKTAVLNSLTCPEAQRGYRHAIDEFVDWYCSEPRLAFNKTVVLRYRIHLESRKLAPGTMPRASTTRSPELGRVFTCVCAGFSISSVLIARSMISQNSG